MRAQPTGIKPMTRTSLLCLVLASCLLAGLGLPAQLPAGEIPTVGGVLPAMEFSPPPLKDDLAYLEIKNQPFKLSELKARLVWLEVIGIYCVRCYEQAPKINRLYKSLEKAGLGAQVKMLAVAAGGTPMECLHVRKNKQYLYAVAPDEDFRIHKILGEPRTPFTMLVDNASGRVLFAHMGVMDDTEGLLPMIKGHLK